MRRTAAVLTATLTAITLAAGCGSDDSSTETAPTAYTEVRDATFDMTEGFGSPTGPVVLTIGGNISESNTEDGTLELDIDQLESLPLVEYETPDLQAEGGVVTFSGVLLTDLLDAVGARDITSLHTTALNDYSIDIPASDLDHAVMVATRVNGERMSVERYGPTRIVYPYGTENLDPVEYDPRWIWQLAEIDVV